jgi:hypothetical protein
MVELLLAVVFGMAGGFARAILGGRLVMPSWDTDENGRRFLDPGFYGTIFVGAVAGLAAWLFNASPADPGIDWRPLGWALIAGAAGDVAIAFYVNQKLGTADRQDAGELLDKTADTAHSATQILKQVHEERQHLQERVDGLETQNNNDKESGASNG